MPRKLKVYCNPAGFFDAYVAAPSQKAALQAWGSKADLFARGIAKTVTDPNLMEEPLSRPGEVIKRSRGSAAEQITAASASTPRTSQKKKTAEPKQKPAAPRPDRSELEEAERQLKEAEARHEEQNASLHRRERDLERERAQLSRTQIAEREKLEKAIDKARQKYEKALRRWEIV